MIKKLNTSLYTTTTVPLKLHTIKKSVRETPNYLKIIVVFWSI